MPTATPATPPARPTLASVDWRVAGTVAARAGWVLLLALHLLPTAAVARRITDSGGGAAGDWASLLLLVAAMALFALKLAGAGFLRLPASRTGRVAVLLAVALLHHDALGLNAADAGVLAAPAAVLIVAEADLRRHLRRGRMRFDRVLTRLLEEWIQIVVCLTRSVERSAATVRLSATSERFFIAPPSRGPPLAA